MVSACMECFHRRSDYCFICNFAGDEYECLQSMCESVEVQCIGAFLHDYPPETASGCELHMLYLKDFVSGVLQSDSNEEAKVSVHMFM